MAEKKVKKKREIPLRSPGAPVNTPINRPSLVLFDEVKRLEELDVPKTSNLDVQEKLSSDAQVDQAWTPNIDKAGRPKSDKLDAQAEQTRTPNSHNTGRPIDKKLDVMTSESSNWTSESKSKSDVKTSGNKNLDVQQSRETEQRRLWEKNRSTDRVTLRPNSEILKKIKIFCVQKNLGLTEFFEISGLKFIELDVQSDHQLDVLTPLDDRRLMMLYRTKPFIINLYLAYNAVFNEQAEGRGKKWTARWSPKDDLTAARYNDLQPAIVELGILQTQIQKGFGTSRIQTFKYYTDEIEKVLSSGVSDEMLQTILVYHRNIWKNQTGREVDLSFLIDKSIKEI